MEFVLVVDVDLEVDFDGESDHFAHLSLALLGLEDWFEFNAT